VMDCGEAFVLYYRAGLIVLTVRVQSRPAAENSYGGGRCLGERVRCGAGSTLQWRGWIDVAVIENDIEV
jgi:hypothetical protein